ncbi:hypothetical protein TNCV_2714291 [Trichonephila clavipes]|nr:hypothetical protein TNCV_2714291 [Trichonephila clavipes]
MPAELSPLRHDQYVATTHKRNNYVQNENSIRNGQRTILLKNGGGDEVRSPKEEMPCLLRFDWSKPIDAESGRGNGLGRSENKRPETRRSWN